MGKMFFPDDYPLGTNHNNNQNNPYYSPTSKLSGRIDRVWVEKNVREFETKGLKIHLDFTINNAINKTITVAVYFYHNNGSPLKDSNGSYRTYDGQVAVSANFYPQNNPAWFNNCELFIPNHELHLNSAQYIYLQTIIWVGETPVTINAKTSVHFSPFGY